jgi:16S rRNA C967 or C1407 C5-methylase (RsmB/RsmF family)
VLHNADFDTYYQSHEGLFEEGEYEPFIQSLRQPLPAAFRINSSFPFIQEVREELLTFMGKEFTIEHMNPYNTQEEEENNQEGEKEGEEAKTMVVKPVSTLDWYPDGLAFQLDLDRKLIRKHEALAPFHRWLVNLSERGVVTRQEAVSMIPPILLSVEPHHRVLDMCAAPGSKTSQLLGMTKEEAGGLVIANDTSSQRAYMLVHHCKRTDNSHFLVTNHQGQFFPHAPGTREAAFYLWKQEIEAEEKRAEQGLPPLASSFSLSSGAPGQFDRILCDVPCSGDGTLRKQPSIFRSWTVRDGQSLHKVQKSLLIRALELCKVGGRVCYSTCSLNPVEDESVVASVLHELGEDVVRVVNVREENPNHSFDHLKSKQGLVDWSVWYEKKRKRQKVMNKEEEHEVQKMEEEEQQQEEQEEEDQEQGMCMLSFDAFSTNPDQYSPIEQSFYAPKHYVEDEDQLASIEQQLRSCVRVLPHQNNSGGFFITILEKVGPMSERERKRIQWREDFEAWYQQKLAKDASFDESSIGSFSMDWSALDAKVRDKNLEFDVNINLYVSYVPLTDVLRETMRQSYPHLSDEFVNQLFIRQDFQVNPQARRQLEKKKKKKLHDKKRREREGKQEEEEEEEEEEQKEGKWERTIYYLSPTLSQTLACERLNPKYQIVSGGVKVFDKVLGRRAIRSLLSAEDALVDIRAERKEKEDALSEGQEAPTGRVGGSLNGIRFEDGITWRIRQEGLPVLLEHHKVELEREDTEQQPQPFPFVRITNPHDFYTLLHQEEETVDLTTLALVESESIMAQLQPISLTSFAFLFDPENNEENGMDDRVKYQFYLSSWKASGTKVSINVKKQMLIGIREDFALIYTPPSSEEA